mmetsp:Transcript_6251/g.11591  ORF Transcript_6251/g.11591 Transcript_6251/m.11591 type:complete len:598 (+) Transcript_6251:130-1923(+)
MPESGSKRRRLDERDAGHQGYSHSSGPDAKRLKSGKRTPRTDQGVTRTVRHGSKLTVCFGPGGRDMKASMVKMLIERLNKRGDVNCYQSWVETCDFLVVSAFASLEDIQEFVGEGVLLDQLNIRLGEWARRVAVEGMDPKCKGAYNWKAPLAKIGEQSSSSSSSIPTTLDAPEHSWMQLVPSSYLEKAKVYLASGEKRGFTMPPSIPKVENHGSREQYAAFKSGTKLMKANLNEHITKELGVLQVHYRAVGDEWRERSYKRVIQILAHLPLKVTKISQLENKRGIGKSALTKIEEILHTGHLAQATELAFSEISKGIIELTTVHGIGEKTARELFQKGYHSVNDLKARGQHELNATQLLGLRYYDDLLLRMPREEAKAIGDFVLEACKKAWPNKVIFGEIGGSYRRGMKDCGDVDLIITTPEEAGCPNIKDLLTELQKTGFLVADLAQHTQDKPLRLSRSHQIPGKQSYMGICKLPPGRLNSQHITRSRRLDIKVYPRDSFPFALIYFTGNDHFNRSLRHYCRKNGFSLSDDGLSRVVSRSVFNEDVKQLLDTGCRTEQDVFRVLGFPYKRPSERNCVSPEIESAKDAGNWLGKTFD